MQSRQVVSTQQRAKTFSRLYWEGSKKSDRAFFQYLKCKKAQDIANQFLQQGGLKACQSVWSELQDKEDLLQEMLHVLQRSDLSFYEKNQMFQTFTGFALSIYEE